MTLLMSGGLTIGVSAIVFLLITLILVGLLLFAKAKLVPSGNVSLKVNGERYRDPDWWNFARCATERWHLLVFRLWWWW